MSRTTKTYCRLCAELKPISELINLQTEEEKCQDIVLKLKRFYITVDFNDNIGPKTVCTECTDSLKCAYDFVIAVERAQTTFEYSVLQHAKIKNECDSDHENITYKSPDFSDEDDIKDDKIIIDKRLDVSTGNHICPEHIESVPGGLNNEGAIEFKVNLTVSDTFNFTNESGVKSENIVSGQLNTDNVKNEINQHTLSEHSDVKDVNVFVNEDNNIVNIVNSQSNDEDTSKNKRKSKKKPSASIALENIDDSQAEELIKRLRSCPVSAIKQTWAEYNWKCAYCETLFVSIDELRSHSMQYHNACNPYQCTDCKRKTIRLDKFLKHVKEHRKYLHYSCYKCYVKVPNIQQASKHKATHITSKHICRGCNTSFPNETDLNEHVSKFLKNMFITKLPEQLQSDNFTCKICKWTSKSTSAFNTHVRTHTDRTRDHTCDTCGKGFYTREALKNHLLTHTDRPQYQCDICKYSFKSVFQLRYHATVHSGEKPFACDQCDKHFRSKAQLSCHSKTHKDIFPYNCVQCDKSFRFKSNLSRHLLQHDGMVPYTCVVCQREIRDLANFYKHLKRKHGIDKEKRKLLLAGDPASRNCLNPETGKVLELEVNIGEPRKKGRTVEEHSRRSIRMTNKKE